MSSSLYRLQAGPALRIRSRLARRVLALTLAATCAACPSSDSASGPSGAAGADRSPAAARPAEVESDAERERLNALLATVLAGDYAEAQPELESLVEARADWDRARLYLGMALQKQRRYDLARPHFEAVADAPDDFENRTAVWYLLGWCRFNLGDLSGAQAAFEAHLAAVPEEGDSHFGLGLIAFEEGELDAALTRFRRSIELHTAVQAAQGIDRSTDLAKAYARMADVHVQRENWEAARADLATCVGLHPPHYEAWYKLHQTLLQLGDERAAAQALREHDMWKAQRSPR